MRYKPGLKQSESSRSNLGISVYMRSQRMRLWYFLIAIEMKQS
ncbi:hypothetical protein C5167_043206 [Papaver somniferum]|uniref:Uncharacterized protein n=1 Tax=Papaver somniferum TaxID=3469 RepID=A0A4Y7L8T9_PAPSO|nr:hypothetical protein C5167_043206 [Papaver somniferum]